MCQLTKTNLICTIRLGWIDMELICVYFLLTCHQPFGYGSKYFNTYQPSQLITYYFFLLFQRFLVLNWRFRFKVSSNYINIFIFWCFNWVHILKLIFNYWQWNNLFNIKKGLTCQLNINQSIKYKLIWFD